MAALRRPVAAPPPPTKSGGSINIFADGFFLGGMGLPEGDYACTFESAMFQPTKQDGTPTRTPPFLAVMTTFYPINPETGESLGEPTQHPISCGKKAHESFVPSEDGKGFDPVPGGKMSGMSGLSNLSVFVESLKQCGLPPGIDISDLSLLDGIWVHCQNVPEPEGRKELRSRTGAAAMQGQDQQSDRPGTCIAVSNIYENGRPWDGTGGIPEAGAAPVAKVAPKAKPAPVAARRLATAPAPVVEEEAEATDADEGEIEQAALAGCTDVLTSKTFSGAPSIAKITLRQEAFKAVKKKFGEEMAQAVMETFYKTDPALGAILGQLGYSLVGANAVAP